VRPEWGSNPSIFVAFHVRAELAPSAFPCLRCFSLYENILPKLKYYYMDLRGTKRNRTANNVTTVWKKLHTRLLPKQNNTIRLCTRCAKIAGCS
jgi:hypothetical protein